MAFNINLRTSRLTLQNIKSTDLNFIFELGSTSAVTKYLDYIKFDSIDQARSWLDEKITANDENPQQALNIIICKKDTLEKIGWIGIGQSSDKSKGDLDFGYAILPNHQGSGYASEALQSILEFGFKRLNAKKIFGECHKDNLPSIKTMGKAGLIFEKYFLDGNEPSVRYSVSI